MSTNSSNLITVSEMSTEEIKQKIAKNKLYLELLESELKKRKLKYKIKTTNNSTKIVPLKTKSQLKPTSNSPNTIVIKKQNITIKDIKEVLDKKHIPFRSNSKKAELEELIRRNNLVGYTKANKEQKME